MIKIILLLVLIVFAGCSSWQSASAVAVPVAKEIAECTAKCAIKCAKEKCKQILGGEEKCKIE